MLQLSRPVWMRQGNCANNQLVQDLCKAGVDIFNSSSEVHIKEAKRICSGCPVKLECLQYAIETEQWGVWGGLTRGSRTRLARKQDKVLSSLLARMKELSLDEPHGPNAA